MIICTDVKSAIVDCEVKYVKEFRCNTEDVENLPVDVLVGSLALDADTGDIYIFNGEEWATH